MTTYAEAKAHYQSLSEDFTAMNKAVNKAIHDDELTDEMELAFFKAEKALHAAYDDMQRIKAAELAAEEEGD